MICLLWFGNWCVAFADFSVLDPTKLNTLRENNFKTTCVWQALRAAALQTSSLWFPAELKCWFLEIKLVVG